MVELLEKVVIEANEEEMPLSEAGVIGMRDGEEHIFSNTEYPSWGEYLDTSGVRIYSCDADCDNCHCATF